jgi:hypothetical protein
MRMVSFGLLWFLALPLGAREPTASDVFWESLQALCGQAFAGRVAEGTAAAFVGQTLIMHVRACGADELRIPLHVGADRSRTWVLSRTPAGLRLKHDHRHEDGTEDAITQYGGDARGPGTAGQQEFPADAFTAELLPAARTNVWTLTIRPGETFTYELRRGDDDRRIRLEFDLTTAVPAPPAPWGHP